MSLDFVFTTFPLGNFFFKSTVNEFFPNFFFINFIIST